jgi:hypothetical protein
MDTDDDSDNENQERTKLTRREALQKAQTARERKFTCRNCENKGHFTVNCPTLSEKEKERMRKARERNKDRKEKVFPFDIEKHIRNSPCGLSVEQAIEMVPGFKKEFNSKVKFRKNLENVNFVETSEESKFTPMTGRAEIEDIEIDAIIDTGAAISIITKGLMKELGYKIDKASDTVLVTADGNKSRSLGKIIGMELLLGGEEIVVTVQVIESSDRMLLLGNDWLLKVRANVDMERKKINIRGRQGYVDIPVKFISLEQEELDDEKEYENSEEEYEEEELREARL